MPGRKSIPTWPPARFDWLGVGFIDFRQGFRQKIAIMSTIKTKTTI